MPPLGVEDGAGVGDGDKDYMTSCEPPLVDKILHLFPGWERERLDDSAGSGRHGSTSDISLTAPSTAAKLSATAPTSYSCVT